MLLASCGNNTASSGGPQSNSSDNQSSVSSDDTSLDDSNQGSSNDETSSSTTVSHSLFGNYDEEQEKAEKEVYVNNVKSEDVGGSDKEAAAMRDSILNAKDPEVNVEGTTYYISPNGDDFNSGTSPEDAWQTLDALKLNSWLFESGDAILLERGGVYRQTSPVEVTLSDMYFGAYGSGPKPAIYGSAKDYADEALWEPSNKKNIWKLQFPQKSAGIIVFDYGTWAGEREMGLASLQKNGDFYHNVTETTFYLYCDKGNPGEVYKNIEIGVDQHIFIVFGGRHDITVDNICFKYTGAHGITLYEDNYNINITNCELGWIGGSVQTGVTRYGNAIQFWDSCWDVNVKNNWIYQVYDAGFTFQYTDHGEGKVGGQYKNINVSNNLIEYCTYSVEIFSNAVDAYLKNITISDNIMRFAGYGWGNQRPSRTDEAHINAWRGDDYFDTEGKSIISDCMIKNNIFDCSSSQIVNWGGTKNHSGIIASANTYYEKAYADNPVMNFGAAGKAYAKNQADLVTAIKTFDKSPKLVKWLG